MSEYFVKERKITPLLDWQRHKLLYHFTNQQEQWMQFRWGLKILANNMRID